MKKKFVSPNICAFALLAAFTCFVTATRVLAQTPDAPPQTAAPAASKANPFPPVDPKLFTATSPSVETVNSFLKSLWGYDANRIWSIVAIEKTGAAGVSKIVVLVADKTQASQPQHTIFYTTPDGNHAIADGVISFGAKPFDEDRDILLQRAAGPAHGAAGKQLLLVEFADLQCPHCKDAETTMDQLAQDFPQARVVFENFPLTEIHPYAFQAAAEGVCVQKVKGDAAFFTYISAVFDLQNALTPESVRQTLATAAAKAGADPAAMATCASTQSAKDTIAASTALAGDLGVDQTPILFINGRALPLTSVPYEVLKRIVVYQAAQDGLVIHVQPSLKTLK